MPTDLTTPERTRAVVVAFIALAVLVGPVTNYTFAQFTTAISWQPFAAIALSSTLAGAALLLVCIARKQPQLNANHWRALLLLLLPSLLASPLMSQTVHVILGFHPIPSGTLFLIALAAPLWLALLSALQLISVEVPRSIVGAAIAGIFAVCLIIPTDTYTIAPHHLPMLVFQLMLGILTVFTWTYAAPRLAGVNILAATGSFLLLIALGNAALSLLWERSTWQAIDWRAIALPLLLHAIVIACCWCLWFWLLQHITLAAFGMRDLAAWTATLIPLLVSSGLLNWRIDLALAIAIAALVISLRARPAEEQPTALGLRDS